MRSGIQVGPMSQCFPPKPGPPSISSRFQFQFFHGNPQNLSLLRRQDVLRCHRG
jgi:hypothetical protein